MEELTLPQESFHTPDSIRHDWLVQSHSICSGGLVVRHDIEPADEFEVPGYTHHCLLLTLNTTSSRQVTRFDDQKYEGRQMNRGEFWLYPAERPGVFAWDGTDEGILFFVSLGHLSQVAAETECINPDQVDLLPVLLGHDPQIEFVAKTFHQEMQTRGLGGQVYAESLATVFCIHLLRHYCTTQPILRSYDSGLSNLQLQQVIDYIHAHLNRSIGLHELAGLLGISSYHFCKLFKQSMGMPPHQYVIQCRVEYAKRLLKKPLTIVEISVLCGFTDQSHLSRHFRRRTGMTPNAYRHHSGHYFGHASIGH
jgi:AraC family transcriptional regulator